MKSNRKTATSLCLINWSRFTNVKMRLEGSSLITGNNGTGKSTVLDAVTYLLTGNTHFNIAAKDRDRSVVAYVRGDTHSEGSDRYLRGDMDVVSYIAMEFFAPEDNEPLSVFVCIELKKDEGKSNSFWYVAKGASLSDIKFCDEKDGRLTVYPKNQLTIKGRLISSKEYMGADKGTKQVIQALGLRCEVSKYRSKLVKMLSFDPQKNIDRFIQECVLEEGKMSSLADLKEQRDNYDEIRQTYDDMLRSKSELETIEECAADYEQKLYEYNKRRLVLSYQNWQIALNEAAEIEKKIEQEKAGLAVYEAQITRKKEELNGARKRLEELNSSDEFRDINSILEAFDQKIQDLSRKKELYGDKVRELEEISQWLHLLSDDLPGELPEITGNLGIIDNLTKVGNAQEKVSVFVAIAKAIKLLIERKTEEKIGVSGSLQKAKVTKSALQKDKSQLESNKLVFPQEFEKAKTFIAEELKKSGINTEVKYLVEWIAEVKDKRWRKAIETFLGNKRFHLIIDPQFCKKALQIVNDHPAYKGKVVISDKLEDVEITPGSAAAQLVIMNPTARKYASYLLNGIYLCDSIDELHEYPKGALMTNGMLAKGYAASKMDMSRTRLYIGQDAIKLQLEEIIKEIETEEKKAEELEIELKNLKAALTFLTKKSLKPDDYDFTAPDELKIIDDSLNSTIADKELYSKKPGFSAIIDEHTKAEETVHELETEQRNLDQLIGGSKKGIETSEEAHEKKVEEARHMEGLFRQECRETPEIEVPAVEMYEQQVGQRGTAISKKTVDEWKGKVDAAKENLENAQLAYCKTTGTDLQWRGVSFIGFYREQYRNLANVKIEEAKQKLEKQGERLQSAFIGDFVAEINEAIEDAKAEIRKINEELKGRPFGNDIYQFDMKERTDSEGKALFFKICRRMHDYLDNPEFYLNSIRDDDDSEQEIRNYIDIVLNEDDETEYTDYRKYFVYDMRIISRQGDSEVHATLSKKQGSASNGEKQTPYFIILAASLLQLYPKDRSSARLAFIDEAFSALSRERIEQMVDYLESNDFQVIYAAPPEKIGSIGSHIQTTITLVAKGRQSFAVEGLVKNIEE